MKTFIKQIKRILPSFLQKKVDDRVIKSKLAKHQERKKRVLVTLSEIDTLLDNFVIDCDVIIHSSTSNIGKIEGGAHKLTDLIISKIDLDKYTLLAPALPFLGPMKDYLDSLEAFDLTTAKNAMGNISNMIMKKDNCKRSLHPTHSVIAIGQNSAFYTEDHELCTTPFCENSPYSKLTKTGGKILMFGVGLNSITNFHVYEDMLNDFLPFNVYTKAEYQIACKTAEKELLVSTKAHNPLLSAKRDCERARKALIDNGYIETYKIGDSEISLLDAKGLTVTLLEMLIDGRSIYGKVKLSKEQKAKVNELLEELR